MRLHQHLTDTGGAAEVTVNLEGWMGIEQVGVGATALTFAAWACRHILQQFLIDVEGLVGAVQACPQVDAPARAPACGALAFLYEGLLAGFQQRRFSEMMAGIESYEVTLVAVVRVVVAPVVIPFVQIALVPNGVGMQALQCLAVVLYIVAAECSCLNGVGQQFAAVEP